MQRSAGGAHSAGVHAAPVHGDGGADHPRALGAQAHDRRHTLEPGRHGKGAAGRLVPLPARCREAGRRPGRRPPDASRSRPARDIQDGERPVRLVEPRQRPVLPGPEKDRRLRRLDRGARRNVGRLQAGPLLLRRAPPDHGVHRPHLRHRLPDLGTRTGLAGPEGVQAGLLVLRSAQRAFHRRASEGLLPVLHPALRAAPIQGRAEARRGVRATEPPRPDLRRGVDKLRRGGGLGAGFIGTRQEDIPGEGGRLSARDRDVASRQHDRRFPGHVQGPRSKARRVEQGEVGARGRGPSPRRSDRLPRVRQRGGGPVPFASLRGPSARIPPLLRAGDGPEPRAGGPRRPAGRGRQAPDRPGHRRAGRAGAAGRRPHRPVRLALRRTRAGAAGAQGARAGREPRRDRRGRSRRRVHGQERPAAGARVGGGRAGGACALRSRGAGGAGGGVRRGQPARDGEAVDQGAGRLQALQGTEGVEPAGVDGFVRARRLAAWDGPAGYAGSAVGGPAAAGTGDGRGAATGQERALGPRAAPVLGRAFAGGRRGAAAPRRHEGDEGVLGVPSDVHDAGQAEELPPLRR